MDSTPSWADWLSSGELALGRLLKYEKSSKEYVALVSLAH
jgi:hypothetical protein